MNTSSILKHNFVINLHSTQNYCVPLQRPLSYELHLCDRCPLSCTVTTLPYHVVHSTAQNSCHDKMCSRLEYNIFAQQRSEYLWSAKTTMSLLLWSICLCTRLCTLYATVGVQGDLRVASDDLPLPYYTILLFRYSLQLEPSLPLAVEVEKS